jgi:hypothetical protein
MPIFRKKPVEIEAHQITRKVIEAHILDKHELPFGLSLSGSNWHQDNRQVYSWRLGIETLEGRMAVAEDDWVIKSVAGELYPCKPEIFEKTYEAV